MPESSPANSRFYRRLADGVQRHRLTEPVLATRPPLVMIGAASGYGKTALAAQIAVSSDFEDVIWIDCRGGGSLEEDLGRVLRLLPSSADDDAIVGDVFESCGRALAALTDDHPVLIILDDAGWATDPDSVSALRSVIAEAPLGAMTVTTTRSSCPVGTGTDTWTIGLEELRLTDGELSEAWRRLTGQELDARSVERLVRASGRHFALLCLLGRNASLLGLSSAPARCSSSVASLISGLVSSQLGERERDLLNYAAVLGDGSLSDLSETAVQPDAHRLMARIADIIPLVSVSGEIAVERYAVHDLVAEALACERALAERNPGNLLKAIASLEASGRPGRALEAAVRSGCADMVADCVERLGSRLLKGSGWAAVCEALDALPATLIASRAGLLLVKAEAEWACGHRVEAIRQAQLAARIAELSDSGGSSCHAYALLPGMRLVLGDFSGIIADVGALLDDDSVRDSDDFGDIVYAAVAAYGFLGDRGNLERAVNAANALVSKSFLSPFRLSRLDSARAIVSGSLDGDPRTAALLMRRAASREGVPSHWRVAATCNAAALALESGDLEGAREDLGVALAAVGDCGTPLDHAMRSLLAATVRGLSGDVAALAPEIERVITCCDAEGERFTQTTSCIRGAETALLFRERAYARDLSERGVAVALEMGSPVLLWLAELVQAHACLASGEADRAAKTAARLLPMVESIGAMGHVLNARLILAEVALREDDLATAIEHLASVSDHIVEKSPALVVASYLRCFPDLFGPLVHAVGAERLPVSILRCLTGAYATEAFDAAAKVLSKSEMRTLRERIQTEASQGSSGSRIADTDEPAVEVKLFGGLEVHTKRGLVAQRDWGKRKARLLFAMLVARHGTDIHRAELIEYLWPDLDEAHGINNFYVVWSAMKRAVTPKNGEEEPDPPFENHNGVCRMIPGRIVSDLDLFTAARAEARCAKAAKDVAAETAALRIAIELYRGDVLPGDIYDDWFGSIRERFRQEYHASVIRFAELMLECGDPLVALPYIIEASARDPLREDLYQARIRLEVGSNQRSAAMGTYMSCRNTLIEELGVDPSRETMALYKQILAMEESPGQSEY